MTFNLNDDSDLEFMLAEAALSKSKEIQIKKESSFTGKVNFEEYKSWANSTLSEIMGLPGIYDSAEKSELRLRVAMHFAPQEAIEFDKSRNESRKYLIELFISQNFSFAKEVVEQLARLTAVVLDNWDASRQPSSESTRHKLLNKQGFTCNSCHLPLKNQERIVEEEDRALTGCADPYKPYYDGQNVDQGMLPVVDHISVISRDGTNSADNLQVLCQLCNLGKGDNSGIRASKELRHASAQIDKIPRGHRMRMFYYRLQMDKFECTKCGSNEKELTVRKKRESGGFVLTNLYSVCYSCIKKINNLSDTQEFVRLN
jgi:hypothetical protein